MNHVRDPHWKRFAGWEPDPEIRCARCGDILTVRAEAAYYEDGKELCVECRVGIETTPVEEHEAKAAKLEQQQERTE